MDETSLAFQIAVLDKISKVTSGLQIYEENLKREEARLGELSEVLEHQREELVKERLDLEKQRKELAESQRTVVKQRVQLEAEEAAARKLYIQAEREKAEGQEQKMSLSDLSKWIQQQKWSVEEERKRLLHEKEGFLKEVKDWHASRDDYESDVTLQDAAAVATEPLSTRFSMTGRQITFAQDRTLSDHVLSQVTTLVSKQDDRLDDTVSFLNTFLAVNIPKVARTNVTRVMNGLQVAGKRMWSEYEAIKKDFAVNASGSTWSGTKFTDAANTLTAPSKTQSKASLGKLRSDYLPLSRPLPYHQAAHRVKTRREALLAHSCGHVSQNGVDIELYCTFVCLPPGWCANSRRKAFK